MRYKKNFPAKVEPRYKEVGRTCDICGKYSFRDTWDDKTGNYSSVELEAKLGDTWPEGDLRITHRLDICGECFAKKVKPAVEALGVQFQEIDSEEYGPSPSSYDGYKEPTEDELNTLRNGQRVYGE